jgi:hypothetical protein
MNCTAKQCQGPRWGAELGSAESYSPLRMVVCAEVRPLWPRWRPPSLNCIWNSYQGRGMHGLAVRREL